MSPSAPAPAPSLARNTAFNAGASLAGLTVGLLLSPILLATLGLERFGFWSLLWAIAGSLGLVDLRLAAAVTPLTAAAWARRERDRVGHVVGTSLAFYAALGLVEVGAAFALMGLPWIVGWIPEGLREEGRFALVAAVAVLALGSVTSVFEGVLHGLQRFDVAARITIGVTVLRGTGLAAVALGGGGLRELLLVEVTLAGAQCLVVAGTVRRLLPDVRVIRWPDPVALRELVAFGGKLQIAYAAHLVALHADKLLLSAFLGLPAVAYYDLGQKIASVVRSLPLLLISATLPVVSTMEASGERERLWSFYLACVRVVVFAVVPLLVLVVTGAGHILLAWAGVSAQEARDAVRLLAVGYSLYVVGVTAGVTAVGMGRPDLEMRRSLLNGGLNLLGSATLIPLLGFVGAPLATAFSFLGGAVYLTRRLGSEFGRSPLAALDTLRRPAVVALPATAASLVVLSLTRGGRGLAIVGLAGSALLIGAAFAWAGMRDGLLRRDWLGPTPVHPAPPLGDP